MRKLEEFVFEKLKVNNKAISIYTTLRKFIAWFEEEDEFRISKFNIEIRNYISSDKSMSKRKITNFLYSHIDDKIYVNEEKRLARNGSNPAIYNYSFDIEDITFSIDAKIYNDSELFSRSKDYILEKLKVSKNNSDLLQLEFRNFVTWYMYDNADWKAYDLEHVKFAEDTVDKYFNGSYKQLYDFIRTHEEEVIYVYEEENTDEWKYIYSFKVDEIPFNLEAFIENTSELLSKQWRILIEKLKVTSNSINGDIKSTMKGFFEWYFGDVRVDAYYWDNVYALEFNNDVITQYFNNDMDEFMDWFKQHMDDTIYVDEVNVDKENYEYTFSCDGIEFVISAWVSTSSTPFSKSKYVVRDLHEKLSVSNKNYGDKLLIELRDFVTWYMYTPYWDADYLRSCRFARKETQKYFSGSYKRLYNFIIAHGKEVIEVSEEKTEKPSIYMYSFDVYGIPFNFEGYIRDDSYVLSKQYKLLL